MTSERFFGLRSEFKPTLKLALPLALGQLAQIGMMLTDTIMLGGLGGDAIAAGGLGGSLYFTLAMILQGPAGSVGILVAHARGAQDLSRIAPAVRGAFLISTLALVPLGLILWNIEPVLLAFGEPPALAGDIGAFVRVLLLGAPAAMWLGTLRLYAASMNSPRMVMIVSFGGLALNAFLNYGFIYGHMGFPEFGMVGSAMATAATTWAMALAIYAWIKLVPELSRHVGWGSFDFDVLRELLILGWPIAVTFAVEALLFMSSGLLMGTLGTTALAAHQVALSVASTTFMIPLACSQAVNVRVGYWAGAAQPRAARDAGLAVFIIGVGFMAFAAVVMIVAPLWIVSLFNLDAADPADAPVVSLFVSLMVVAACFQVFDGAQCIAVGALRGLKDTRIPMWLAGLSYWAIGFPAALVFGFGFDGGAEGIWWGLALGLAAAAIVLPARFWCLSSRLIVVTAR